MARCASLKSRAADPLAIEMVELEQEELERQQRQQREMMEHMLLTSPTLASSKQTNDPIDFFGAIRNLVETNIPPEDIEKYTPVRDHPLHPGAFDAYMEAAARERAEGASDSEEDVHVPAQKIVQEHKDSDLRAENRFLRERLSEVEIALQQSQEHSHRLVSLSCTFFDRVEGEMRGPKSSRRNLCVRSHLNIIPGTVFDKPAAAE